MSGIVVTPETKVGDLLEAHPEIEETLIAIAPRFKALKNPVLRRTVARVASLEQAARVAEMPVNELVRALRAALGHDVGEADVAADGTPDAGDAPAWIGSRPGREFDADSMLADGVTPIAKVSEVLVGMAAGQTVLIRSSFEVAPLIDALRGKGHEVFSRKIGDEAWEAWVRKSG